MVEDEVQRRSLGGYEDLRVVVVADNASAKMGGEAILPLHYFRRLRARGVEAWLVVHERTRQELERSDPDLQDHIRYVPDSALHRWLYRVGAPLPDRIRSWSTGLLLYGLTQLQQRTMVRQLVADHGISVVHQPTPVSPRVPSALWNLGAPVVIGPLNGGMSFPPGFRCYESLPERLIIALGRSASQIANKTLPGKRQAAAILVSNTRTREALPRGCDRNVIELVENGVDLNLFNEDRLPPRTHGVRGTRTRFAFVGRLVDWKAVDLLLQAVALAAERIDLELFVIGDGPERSKLESQARDLGLEARVVFHGFVPQHECPALLSQADALVLPSLYECGGAVVLEAMAMGLPVIATRSGGPVEYLHGGAGLLVDPSTPEEFIAGLADAMVRLATSASLRQALSARGRKRIEEQYDWERKIDSILGIYRDALDSSLQRSVPSTPQG